LYAEIQTGQYRIIEQERFVSKFCVLTRRGFAAILAVLQEISAARTELAQGTEAKIRAQNFRKAPRQRDRSLRKEPRL
jgi:hypothetical protein